MKVLEERQLARKQHLKEYCLKHKFNNNPNPEDLDLVTYDDELKIIYCVIPKVGTTTWKEVLAQSRGLAKNTDRWEIWKRLSNCTDEVRLQRMKMYLKFVFVREPLQRLVSAYRDRLIKHRSTTKDVRQEIVQAFRPQDFEPEGKNEVSFREFIQYFSNNRARNKHWRQYEKLCHPCVINYDFIGHLETLEEDAALLLKMAEIDDRVSFPPIHNTTGSSEVPQYYSQVPPEYITRIGEQYRGDFEMFGYEFLGPVKSLIGQPKEAINLRLKQAPSQAQQNNETSTNSTNF